MSLDKTRARIIKPILSSDQKMARPGQRLVANLFDMALLGFIVFNTYNYFNVPALLPKMATRHHYLVVVIYYYFILTILPHHYFGQTIGQAITGIKIKAANSKRLPFLKIVVRGFLRPTSLFIPTPVLKKKSPAWYDLFLKATVVDVR